MSTPFPVGDELLRIVGDRIRRCQDIADSRDGDGAIAYGECPERWNALPGQQCDALVLSAGRPSPGPRDHTCSAIHENDVTRVLLVARQLRRLELDRYRVRGLRWAVRRAVGRSGDRAERDARAIAGAGALPLAAAQHLSIDLSGLDHEAINRQLRVDDAFSPAPLEATGPGADAAGEEVIRRLRTFATPYYNPDGGRISAAEHAIQSAWFSRGGATDDAPERVQLAMRAVFDTPHPMRRTLASLTSDGARRQLTRGEDLIDPVQWNEAHRREVHWSGQECNGWGLPIATVPGSVLIDAIETMAVESRLRTYLCGFDSIVLHRGIHVLPGALSDGTAEGWLSEVTELGELQGTLRYDRESGQYRGHAVAAPLASVVDSWTPIWSEARRFAVTGSGRRIVMSARVKSFAIPYWRRNDHWEGEIFVLGGLGNVLVRFIER